MTADLHQKITALLFFGLLAGACGPSTERPPDILLVTIDTLRRDFVSAYGYPRPSTPRLDSLAREGALFLNHFTTIATTAPAHATMFTGLYAREHGLTKNGQFLNGDLPNLPQLLRSRGYRTAASIGARILGSKHGFARGFDSFDEDFGESVLRPTGKSGKYERYAESVVDRAIDMTLSQSERPLFLWVHLYDAHEPYAPPRPSPLQPSSHLDFFRKRAESSNSFSRELLGRMLAGYEAEVFYVDRQMGRLIDAWNKRPGGTDSVIIVTSDHGEGLGEHAYQGHGFLLYEEQVSIPLVIRAPGRFEPDTRIEAISSTIDIGATILDCANYSDSNTINGFSLLSISRSSDAKREAYAERRHFKDTDLKRSEALSSLTKANARRPIGSIGEKCMLVRDGWKFIWNANGRHELYRLPDDPREKDNLVAEFPERAAELEATLEKWRTRELVSGQESDEEAADAETQEMLDALGY